MSSSRKTEQLHSLQPYHTPFVDCAKNYMPVVLVAVSAAEPRMGTNPTVMEITQYNPYALSSQPMLYGRIIPARYVGPAGANFGGARRPALRLFFCPVLRCRQGPLVQWERSARAWTRDNRRQDFGGPLIQKHA